MPETNQVQRVQKDVKIWSSRKQLEVALRIYFDVADADGCRIYSIRQVDEVA